MARFGNCENLHKHRLINYTLDYLHLPLTERSDELQIDVRKTRKACKISTRVIKKHTT